MKKIRTRRPKVFIDLKPEGKMNIEDECERTAVRNIESADFIWEILNNSRKRHTNGLIAK